MHRHTINAILSSCVQHRVLHFTTLWSSFTDMIVVQVCRDASNKKITKLKMAKEKYNSNKILNQHAQHN